MTQLLETATESKSLLMNETCLLDILDTEDKRSILKWDQCTRTGEGFFLVCAITSRSSFEEVNTFSEQIVRVKDKDRVPIVICGNKCDLEDERQVSAQKGQDLVKSFRAPFLETSAKSRVNVEESFYELVREIKKDGICGSGDKKGEKDSLVLSFKREFVLIKNLSCSKQEWNSVPFCSVFFVTAYF